MFLKSLRGDQSKVSCSIRWGDKGKMRIWDVENFNFNFNNLIHLNLLNYLVCLFLSLVKSTLMVSITMWLWSKCNIWMLHMSHMQYILHMQHLYFAYATYFTYATSVFSKCNICRICNTCTSHIQHISHMQHIFTKSDFFQKVPDEIFFNVSLLIPAREHSTKLKKNLLLSKNCPGGSQNS